MSEPNDAAYVQHLESEIAKLTKQLQERGNEINRLKKEKGISSARDGLSFNKKTGIWEDQQRVCFCPKCLDKEKRNPLTEDEEGWRCSVCDSYYYNPDAAPPKSVFFLPGE